MEYDFLIVGSGLFGSVFAHEATNKGYKCLVIDKREHKGGNIYCENVDGINVHKYGAHIFHTNDEEVWQYMNRFVSFNNYINSPMAIYNDEIYNLPFNMNTFSKMWGIKTPKEAREIITRQIKKAGVKEPKNLEEQAIMLVGTDIYEKLVKGYTKKQWGRECKDLPAFIIKRLPIRYTYDNNYFNDIHQGIPIGGYNVIIDKLLEGSNVKLNTSYADFVKDNKDTAKKIIYTGMIDEFYNYKFGKLNYRSVRFENIRYDNTDNYQGCAVVNYTSDNVPYTRIIEHKHFEYGKQNFTIISKEYSTEWHDGIEPYYPVNDDHNNELYNKYYELAKKEENIYFGGRLGNYKYYDMDKVVRCALDLCKEIL
ncbi:MAG: UDP-galactopyranose mutase [Lachnospiraceae bacterium]|nr:UDP-galactopyranose mutase [Lachnospiraceae bacterium]